MLAHCARFGGVLTVNWHDRSVAPERLWDQSYRELLSELKTKGAWFATAGQVVSWFRKRRAAQFETNTGGIVEVVDRIDDGLPPLHITRHNAAPAHSTSQSLAEASYVIKRSSLNIGEQPRDRIDATTVAIGGGSK